MTDQSSVENRHIGHRTFLSGAIDSLAGVMPDTLDAGALCFVSENATVYQWLPGNATAASSPGVIRPTGRPGAGCWKPINGGPSEAVAISIAVPQLDPDTSDDGLRVANPFTRAINVNSIIMAQFRDSPGTGVAISSVFVDGIQIGLMFSNTSTSPYGGANLVTNFVLFPPPGT